MKFGGGVRFIDGDFMELGVLTLRTSFWNFCFTNCFLYFLYMFELKDLFLYYGVHDLNGGVEIISTYSIFLGDFKSGVLG
jgi:hypothetical protein